ncbi:hypothetical protein [Paracoccus laeviglucosivorans]|uniref:Uncharacterized protein n=1 Tax=Paracoccus laeviglucosivorans TaxID=1197861 RepID=A0A521E5K3_9RHOB|nr:hypothetical protein [Paracoccus laeviglucosivorans]SMO78651.1 hypothetical protein SAMN06265221_11142 [Paracoccus laeviglucosivorans]
MVVTTDTPGAIYVGGQAPSKEQIRRWMNEVVTQINAELGAVIANGGKIFADRAAAVAAGNAALPGTYGRIITIEDGGFAVRGPGQTSDDPLFGSAPTWGVLLRLPGLATFLRGGIIPLTITGGIANWPVASAIGVFASIVSAIANGDFVSVSFTSSNSGPMQLTVGGISAASPVLGADGQALVGGEIVAGRNYILQRRGSNWRIVSGDISFAEMATERLNRITADVLTGTVQLTPISGTGDAITAALPADVGGTGIFAANLRRIRFQAQSPNTGAVTINIAGQGAVSLRNAAGGELAAAYLSAGRFYEAVKDGSTWRIQSGEVTRSELSAEAALRASAIDALNLIMGDISAELEAPLETVLENGTNWTTFDALRRAIMGWDATGLIAILGDRTIVNAAPRVFAQPVDAVVQTVQGQTARVLDTDADGNAVWVWKYGADGGFDGIMSQDFWDRGRDALNIGGQFLSTTEVELSGVNGQSLTVGGPYNAAFTVSQARALANDGCLEVAGMTRGDNVLIADTLGPRGQGYNLLNHGTGLERGMPGAAAPGLAFGTFAVLNLHRKDLGLPQIPVVTSCHGIAGIPIEEMDDDPDTGNTTNAIVWSNFAHWSQSSLQWANAAGKKILPGWHVWCHGTSAQNMLRGEYAQEWWDLQGHSLEFWRSIGFPTPRYIFGQPGGNTNITTQPWAVCDDILDICEQGGAVLGAIEYWYPIDDNNVHPDAKVTMIMGETNAWAISEVEAGNTWTIKRPRPVRTSPTQLVLHFDSLREDETLELEAATKYNGQGIDAFFGFQLTGGTITGVVIRGNTAVITHTGSPTAVKYAMQAQVTTGFEGNRFTSHRGLLRTSLRKQSKIFADEMLVRPIPSFTLPL